MYIAKEKIVSAAYGTIEKGQEAPLKEAWLEAGLIEEGKPKKLETKPNNTGKRAKK